MDRGQFPKLKMNTLAGNPTLQEIVDEQSRTITKLCEAIDPTFSHGPETDKICAYARQCREFFENNVLLKRIENLERMAEWDRMTDGPMPLCNKCGHRHLTTNCPT